MGIFGNNDAFRTDTNKKPEEFKALFVNRLEPITYARLGEEGVDVKADELINVIEKLAVSGSVYTYEINPLIADYLMRTGSIKTKNVNRELNKYVATSQAMFQNIKAQSVKVLEDFQEKKKSPFLCNKCGTTHYIGPNNFKVDIEFSINGLVSIEYAYTSIPYHGFESLKSENMKGYEAGKEYQAIGNYRYFHKMDSVKVSYAGLKNAFDQVTAKIYFDSGLRESQIYVFGISYRVFKNEFLSGSLDEKELMLSFLNKMYELEQQNTEHADEISNINKRISELEKESHRTVYGFAFDFCVLAEGSSVYVIEVKGWKPNMISDVVSSNLILLTENNVEPSKQGSPLDQVVGYRNKMIDLLRDELHVKAYVLEFVCYPFISKEEYKKLKLNYVSEEFNTLFKEDLEDPNRLIQKFNDRYAHAIKNILIHYFQA